MPLFHNEVTEKDCATLLHPTHCDYTAEPANDEESFRIHNSFQTSTPVVLELKIWAGNKKFEGLNLARSDLGFYSSIAPVSLDKCGS